jgi:hypothetical protein
MLLGPVEPREELVSVWIAIGSDDELPRDGVKDCVVRDAHSNNLHSHGAQSRSSIAGHAIESKGS